MMADTTRIHHTRLMEALGKVVSAHQAVHQGIATHAQEHAADREKHLQQLDAENRLNGMVHSGST